MKKNITISSVVFAHAAAFLFIAGCQTQSGFEDKKPGDSSSEMYSGSPVNKTGTTTTTAKPAPAEVRDTQPPPPPPPPPPVKEPPVTPPPPPPQPAGREYIVKRGDTLWTIAKREGITAHALADANGLPDNALLKQKQKIIIPGKSADTSRNNNTATPAANNGTSTDGQTTIHVVKKNEVLGTIARQYKVSVASIQDLNGITDPRKIRVGQKLKIPASKAGSTTATAKPQPDAQPAVDPVSPLVPDSSTTTSATADGSTVPPPPPPPPPPPDTTAPGIPSVEPIN